MKLISLNIWDARIFRPLMNFFETHEDVDIFCLQEVFNGTVAGTFRGQGLRINGYAEIASRLPNHIGHFAQTEILDDKPEKGFTIPYGLAIFINKKIKTVSHQHDFVFGDPSKFSNNDGRTHRRIIQTVCILQNNKTIGISNFHGLWNGQGKTDTPDRIEQSQKLRNHIDKYNHAKILSGDFNLLPDTKSLAIAKEGMRDLIAEHGITSTRSKLYNRHEKPVLFADYIFTSPDIDVTTFKVLPDVVSDHLPLFLEFS
jgi:endonuclease/exonuclease/phosphatase family metal-dependent hydrolase